MNLDYSKKIIVSVESDDIDQARKLISEFAQYSEYVKFGLVLLQKYTPETLCNLANEFGLNVFLDVKLHDIENTVTNAYLNIVNSGAKMINLHASAGAQTIKNVSKHKGSTKLIAVGILTNIDDNECNFIYGDTVLNTQSRLLNMAVENGADGIVCSGSDLKYLNKFDWFDKVIKIVPGIRPDFSSNNDQKRIMTPFEALKNGADYLVIGRPITANKDLSPKEAYIRIVEQIINKMEE